MTDKRVSDMESSHENYFLPVGRRSIKPNAIAPDGSEIRFLINADNGATKSSLVEVVLGSDQLTRPVRHQTVEETWYVLNGTGKIWRCPPNTEPALVPATNVSPGDSVVIPTGWIFQFQAGPKGPLQFLCHTTPPWPGDGEAVLVEVGGLGEATV